MTRRSKMEIYLDIIKAVADGKHKPTHILYRANLSWMRLKECLDFLIEQGFLEETILDKTRVFSVTSKGKEVLGYYSKINAELDQKKKILPPEIYIQYT